MNLNLPKVYKISEIVRKVLVDCRLIEVLEIDVLIQGDNIKKVTSYDSNWMRAKVSQEISNGIATDRWYISQYEGTLEPHHFPQILSHSFNFFNNHRFLNDAGKAIIVDSHIRQCSTCGHKIFLQFDFDKINRFGIPVGLHADEHHEFEIYEDVGRCNVCECAFAEF